MDRKKIIFILAVVPLILELVAMFFLPEQIPVHYDAQFQVTAYGSKFMLLVAGVMTLVFGMFIRMVYQVNEKTENEDMVFRFGMVALLVFYVVNGFGLVGAFCFG